MMSLKKKELFKFMSEFDGWNESKKLDKKR